MKRSLCFVSGLFVLGELLYRLFGRTNFILIPGLITILVFILSSIFKTFTKGLNLLLFLSIPLGYLWGMGLYSDGEKLASYVEADSEVRIEAYINAREETSLGVRLTMKCDEGSFIMYVNQDSDIGDVAFNDLLPGTYLRASGHFKRLRGSTNPGAVDMEQYYIGKGIECEFKADHIEIDHSKRRYVIYYLNIIKRKMGRVIDKYFETDDAAILKTMILGEKSGLSTETKLLFQRSGIAHVLAISGLHVGLLAGIISWLLSLLRIRRGKAEILSIVIIFLYGLMTGFSPATLRAVIMITVYKMAFLCGRTADVPTCMMEALLIMIILNPESIFSIGLLMSFASVLGVFSGTEFYRYIFGKERFLELPIKLRGYLKMLLNGLLISMSINLWMLPLVITSYYEVPLYSMLLNFIVLPLLTVVIICGGLVMLLGTISGYIPVFNWGCYAVSRVCSFILGFYKWLCSAFLRLPGSTILTGHSTLWQVIAYYVLVILLLVVLRRMCRGSCKKGRGIGAKERNEDRKIKVMGKRYLSVILAYIFCMGSFIGGVWLFNRLSFHISFLDVGQGDGSIIHTGKRNYIIDAGSSDNSSVGRYVLIPALKYFGMKKVDMIFVSHTDADHISGIIYLLENSELYGIEIGGVAFAAGTERDENYERIEDIVGRERILELSAGDVIEDDIEVLYPTIEAQADKGIEHGGNDYSLVLEYRNKEKSLEILYTGDIGGAAEEKLSDELSKKTTTSKVNESIEQDAGYTRIIKCAHHGSKYSSSEEFLSIYDPDITVISCGEHNMYGHPSPETLKRLQTTGTKIIRTDQNGAVILE